MLHRLVITPILKGESSSVWMFLCITMEHVVENSEFFWCVESSHKTPLFIYFITLFKMTWKKRYRKPQALYSAGFEKKSVYVYVYIYTCAHTHIYILHICMCVYICIYIKISIY